MIRGLGTPRLEVSRAYSSRRATERAGRAANGPALLASTERICWGNKE